MEEKDRILGEINDILYQYMENKISFDEALNQIREAMLGAD